MPDKFRQFILCATLDASMAVIAAEILLWPKTISLHFLYKPFSLISNEITKWSCQTALICQIVKASCLHHVRMSF